MSSTPDMVRVSTATRRSGCSAVSASHSRTGAQISGGSFPSMSTVSGMTKR